MLVGGGVSAGLGVLVGSESAVILLYIIGAIGGALAGMMVGRRWRRGRRVDA